MRGGLMHHAETLKHLRQFERADLRVLLRVIDGAAAVTATGSSGVYANRSYITGRPTLIPRYYGGYGAYAADGYPMATAASMPTAATLPDGRPSGCAQAGGRRDRERCR